MNLSAQPLAMGEDSVEVVTVEEVQPIHMAPVTARTEELDHVGACERAIGYTFFDKHLIRKALTHSSSAPGHKQDNERMEFFGDAVLDLVIREYLYFKYPDKQEGELTEAKSAVVCRASLVKASQGMGMKDFLYLGRGMGKRRPVPESLLANAFEAIVAAIYMDGGYQPARNFILAHLEAEIPIAMDQINSANYKSNLQKLLQQYHHPLPVYRVTGTSGPEHSKTFDVVVVVDGREVGHGTGTSKKAAEQEAARQALAFYEEGVLTDARK